MRARMLTASADVTQVKASVSLPGVTIRPTRAYWQANTGAIVKPDSRPSAAPLATDRAAINGAVQATAASSSAR